MRTPSEIDLTQRGSIEKAVAGALKDSIAAHGPITQKWVGSAAKRVIGALKTYNKQQRAKHEQAGHNPGDAEDPP